MVRVSEVRTRTFTGTNCDKVWEASDNFIESFSYGYSFISRSNSSVWGVVRDDFVVTVQYSVTAQALEDEDERRGN